MPYEIKQEILAKVKLGEKVTVLAGQYGVSDKAIYYWLRGKAIGAMSLLKHQKLKKENQQLKEIIGILALELDKSKKRKASVVIAEKIPGINRSLLA